MEAHSAAEQSPRRNESLRWRLWALVPIVLLVAVVSLFAARGGSLLELVGENPPPPDAFDVRRVEFSPGEIRIRVTNPQREDLTIATVTVDDAIVPFTVDGPATLGRLRSATIVVPYAWVEDEPIAVGVTSSTGIQTTHEIAAAVETPEPSPGGFLGYAIIGALVGIVPVALGLLWLPSLRRARPEWLAAFMALTGGLLTFLAIEALTEALELQAALARRPGRDGAGRPRRRRELPRPDLPLAAARPRGRREGRHARRARPGDPRRRRDRRPQPRRGPRCRKLVRARRADARDVPHRRVHAPQRHGGAGDRRTGRRGGAARPGRLTALVLVAGAPTIFGAWIGGYLTNDVLAVLFFSIAAGAALQVVVEVVRYVARRAPGGLTSGYAVGGFLAGLALMYATGLLV